MSVTRPINSQRTIRMIASFPQQYCCHKLGFIGRPDTPCGGTTHDDPQAGEEPVAP